VTDEAFASTPRSLSVTLAGRVDRACDRFEADWNAGQRPRIEAYLADAPETDRPLLLRELLLLELEFRQGDGERPIPGEYRARFPRDERLLNSAFEAAGLTEPAARPEGKGPANADRNLLFGILAARTDLASRDALVAAMQAWVVDKSRPLGQILTEQEVLSGPGYRLLEALTDEHLRLHDGDPTRSLRAAASPNSTWEDLARITDPDLQASLAQVVARAPDGTSDTSGRGSAEIPTTGGFRFRILRPHAQGGLGRVYVARDEEVRRDVALKQIHDQFAHDPHSRARFLLEAEVTGKLEHPGVVPVYGLGRDASGRPYYAMRFIRGDSLKQAIAQFHAMDGPGRDLGERALALRQLLGRFVSVCNTVAYAHSRGVIHRDLKPDNILLGPYSETLVVDWGLAKLVGRPAGAGHDAEGALELESMSDGDTTLPGSPVGTPQYMSPEQASGRLELLGEATDVYGLGATLYCVLTGRAPIDDRRLATVLQKVQRGEFPPPRSVKRTVPAALEAICLKAMARDRKDRYSTPQALADDLEHWLADEPISAWREPVSVRARRWVARHRTTVTTAAAAVLVALVGLAAITALEDRSRRELSAKNRDLALANARAERRVDLALRAIQSFRQAVEGHIDVENPADLAPLRQALLREPLEFYSQLKADLQESRDARPETQARLALAQFELAMITAQTDSQENAMTAYREALDVLDPIARDHPEVTTYRVDLASIYGNLGKLQFETGHPDEALVSLTRSRDLREALARDNPAVIKHRDQLAAADNNLGLLHLGASRPGEALACLERAIAIQEALVREHPAAADYRASLARSLLNLGRLQMEADRPAVASAGYERARVIADQLVRDHPGVAEHRALLASACQSIGWIQVVSSQPADASASYERAHGLYEGLTREHPSHTTYRSNLASILIDLGTLRILTGRHAQSFPLFQRAQELLDELIREHPNDLGLHSRLAKVMDNRGIALAEQGRHREAEEAFLAAIARHRGAFEQMPDGKQYRQYLSSHYANLARVRRAAGRPAEAANASLERRTLLAGDPDKLYSVACELASCIPLVEQGRGDSVDRWRVERRKYIDLALETLRQAIGAGYQDIALMRSDPELNPLRSSNEFQSLLSDLTFPVNPFAP
jgi:serine/threonine-protein kinase